MTKVSESVDQPHPLQLPFTRHGISQAHLQTFFSEKGDHSDLETSGWLLLEGSLAVVCSCMEFYAVVWDSMQLYGILCSCMEFYAVVWNSKKLYGVVWKFMDLYRVLCECIEV